jgi:FMN-dependent NADH-azoreductase
MATLLHIEASPRKKRSHSLAVANEFVQAYQECHEGASIDRLDLWSMDLPPFDGAALDAKYKVLHGDDATEDEKRAWRRVVDAARDLFEADAVLLSVPMWNFGIPYRLKHYIDVVTQPGVTFKMTEEGGYEGLVTGKPAVVVYASGGDYPKGSPMEAYNMQSPYVELWLQFIGFETIHTVDVRPTLGGDLEATRTNAVKRAKEIAATL